MVKPGTSSLLTKLLLNNMTHFSSLSIFLLFVVALSQPKESYLLSEICIVALKLFKEIMKFFLRNRIFLQDFSTVILYLHRVQIYAAITEVL